MIVKLLTEHYLEFLGLKGGCRGSFVRVYTCQNATLLEITCTGSYAIREWLLMLLVDDEIC